MIKKVINKFSGVPFIGPIIATNTFQQSSITFSGTFLNGALGAVFYILAARYLGPAAFGLMNVAIVALTLVADIGDLGTDTGLVNFIPKYIKKAPDKAKRFLKLGLEIKLVVGVVILVTGYFLAPYLAEHVFAKPELTVPLKIAFVGVIAALLFSFITHSLQAFQKFWAWSGIQVGTNVVRVLIIAAFVLYGRLTVASTLTVYVVMPLLGFLVGIFLIPIKFWKVEREASIAREFFKYNKWVAAFTIAAAFSSRLDTFISARLLDSTELGLYSAASQLVKIIPQFVVAFGTVIAPKMAEMGSIEDLVKYLKKTQLMILGLALLGLLSTPIILYLIPVIFGVSYLGTGPIFVVLLLAMLVFLVSVPLHMSVFYYFSYPKLFFWMALAHLAIIAGVGWNMISMFGAMGAATTVLVGQLFNLAVPTYWVIARIRRERR